jgi:hypothetical protein
MFLKTLFHLMFMKKKTYLFQEIFAQKDLFDDIVEQDDAILILCHADRALLKRRESLGVEMCGSTPSDPAAVSCSVWNHR